LTSLKSLDIKGNSDGGADEQGEYRELVISNLIVVEQSFCFK